MEADDVFLHGRNLQVLDHQTLTPNIKWKTLGYADGTELFLKFLTLFVVVFNLTCACPVKLQFHCYSKQRGGATPISKRNLIHGSLWLSGFQQLSQRMGRNGRNISLSHANEWTVGLTFLVLNFIPIWFIIANRALLLSFPDDNVDIETDH